jgi:hypothetical protein
MPGPDIHFVLSAPRSGSTWLSTALNQHPEVFATEHRLFGQFCELWKNNDGSTSPRITFDSYAKAFSVHYFYQQLGMDESQFIDGFQKSFVNYIVNFAKRKSGKRIVIDKITPYPGTATFVVQQIRKLFPDSKIIQLVRDGRDVLTSGTYDWLLKDAEGTDRYRFYVQSEPGMKLDRFFDDVVIEKWANNWRETIDAFDQSGADTQVTYERMKENLAAELQSILRTVGANEKQVATDASFAKMSGRKAGDASDPTAKARKGIVGDWKNHFTKADGELFDSICGSCLIDMGYEPNRNWISELPEALGLTTSR